MVAAAVVGGAALGTIGSVVAGNEAANATKDASSSAIAAQKDALAKQTALEAPFVGAGKDALAVYQNLLGIGPNGKAVDPNKALTTLRSLPGYQFTKSEGLDATRATAAAEGLGLSGNALKALDTYSTGLADNTYNAELGNLQGLVGIGQSAASGQAANVGAAAGNIGNIAVNQGRTTAGIDANTVAGITKSVGGAADNYLSYQTMKNLNPGGSTPLSQDLGGFGPLAAPG